MAYSDELQKITSKFHSPMKTSIISAIGSCMENIDQGNYELAVRWAGVIEDWSWERLHSGHWKDVPVYFRELYSMAIILKVEGLKQCNHLKEALQTADKGILLGAPILNNRLQKLTDEIMKEMRSENRTDKRKKQEMEEYDSPLKKKIKCDGVIDNKCASPQPNSCQRGCVIAFNEISSSSMKYSPIDKIHCPSLDVFLNDYMKPVNPVVLTGCMKQWPSMGGNRRWSVSYLKDVAGLRTVPIELGSRYTDDGWSQQLMTINEFIESYIESESKIKGYLAQHTLFQQIPQLQDDICIPDYCCLSDNDNKTDDEDVKINAWFGPKGTVSPLHFDPQHNLLSQVVGSKFIVLFDKADTPLLYPHAGVLSNTSQVDIDCPDYANYPLFEQANGFSCLLEEGEMLYIPPKWWHYVRSLSLSFSVSFWWS